MKSRQRRSFSAEMKARIAVEAIKGQKTIQEIASHYGVHPSQVTNWKRQATVDSNKIAIEIIKSALADANDTTPAMTAARKIQDRANLWKAQQHTKLDLNDVYLESIANELKALSSRNVNRRDALQQIVNREEAQMSLRSVHAALVKTGGPQ